MTELYQFAMMLRIHNPMELYRAAIAHRAAWEAEASFCPADPVEHWGAEYRDAEGNVDIHACLVELLDPGVSPDGCEILDSSAHYGGEYGVVP